jgi:glycosyltransferase involved in cell wall biosynthesis
MTNFSEKTLSIAYLRHFADLEAGGITRDSLGLISDMKKLSSGADNLNISYLRPRNTRFISLRRRLNLPMKFANLDGDFVWLEQILPIEKTLELRPIVRVHDIFPITNPRWFRFWTVMKFRRNIKILLRLNPILIFNSDASLSSFMRRYPTEKYLSFVIWCKPNLEAEQKCGICAACGALQDLILPNKYCLLIGTIEPRKNYKLIIDLLSSEYNLDLKFVVIGRYGWKQNKVLRKLKKLHPSRLLIISNACDAARVQITKNSSIFMSTSLNEGFGMPAAEARSLGVNLILSDIPVYREIHDEGNNVTFVSLETPPLNWLKSLDKTLQSFNGEEMWLEKFESTRLLQFSTFLNALNAMSVENK